MTIFVVSRKYKLEDYYDCDYVIGVAETKKGVDSLIYHDRLERAKKEFLNKLDHELSMEVYDRWRGVPRNVEDFPEQKPKFNQAWNGNKELLNLHQANIHAYRERMDEWYQKVAKPNHDQFMLELKQAGEEAKRIASEKDHFILLDDADQYEIEEFVLQK